MYSKILVAVDGSDTSLHALQQAIELAMNLSATLRIVHVVDMNWLPLAPELAIDIEAISTVRRSAGEKTLAAARETARKAGLESEFTLMETETPTQHVAETIAKEASRWPADLVVLGTHGRRGFRAHAASQRAWQGARLSPSCLSLSIDRRCIMNRHHSTGTLSHDSTD